MSQTKSKIPKVRLTDEGLETPEHLIGVTGVVTVEKPDIKMDFTFVGEGVKEFSQLITFPPTDPQTVQFVPEGHVRIDGQLYEVIDEREHNECPHCGSDKVTQKKCYSCDTEL